MYIIILDYFIILLDDNFMLTTPLRMLNRHF